MSAPDLPRVDFLRQLARELDAAVHGGKAALIQRGRDTLKCSAPALYRALHDEAGWGSGRRRRADKGDASISYEELAFLSTLWVGSRSRRENGKQLRRLRDVIDIAFANGKLTQRISEATASRLLELHNLHPSQLNQPAPHVQMASLHPNHVWQIDPSLCVVYYSKREGLRIVDERDFYDGKPEAVERIKHMRVWRYVQTDHYTGALYCRYYLAKGENQQILADFMMRCMAPDDPRHVMRGVPYMLVWDAGSANTCHGMKQMLTALQVRHWAHKPKGPRAKGQVENGNNLVERGFEGLLGLCHLPSVEELNAELAPWLIKFNATEIHGRHKHTRYGLWQTIQTHQLRDRPAEENCRNYMTSKPEQRTVRGDLTIQFAVPGHGSLSYSVADVPNVCVGKVLQVVVHAYRVPSICVMQEDVEGLLQFIACDPIQTDAAGFPLGAPVFGQNYKRHADTVADTGRKAISQLAYGTTDSAEVDKLQAKGIAAFNGEIDPFKHVREAAAAAPSHMVRRGTELHVPNPVQIELKPLSLVEALQNLRVLFGRPIKPEERELLAQWYPQGVPETDLQDIVNRLSQPIQEERPRLAIVR